MAITRAQQAKQMLQDGGRIGFKQGQGGQGQSRRGGAPGGRRAGPGTGSGGGKDRDKGSDFGQFDRAVKRAKDNPEITAGGGDGGGILDKVQDKLRKTYVRRTKASNLKDLGVFGKISKMPGILGGFIDAVSVPEETDEFDIDSIREIASTKKAGLSDFESDTLGDLREDIQMENALEKGNVSFNEFQDYLNRNRLPEDIGGEGGQPIIPIIPQVASAPVSAVDDYYGPGGNPFLNRTAYRLLAEGGFLDDEDYVGGGIMDASGRQQYFLGKLVKSAKKAVKGVTRAVKKVAKSPLGKIAILGGLGAYAGGFGPFSSGKFGAGFLKGPMRNILFGKSLGYKTAGDAVARSGGLLGLIKDNPMLALAGGLTAAPFLFGQEDEGEETQTLDRGQGLDIPGLRARGMRFDPTLIPTRFAGSQFQFAADGGRIGLSNGTEAGADVSKEIKKIYKNFKKMKSKGVDDDILKMNTDYEKNFDVLNKLYNQGFAEGSKEPVAKKTMPLLDMGGKEMDLREEGGFVPIGRMEKADDVPARLSKNEFVFTADAVRNAGDGNVDKGAEVMYNMMKNLESGGDVSEESQGLEGARKMFQTSQRLEEVL